MLIIVSGLPGTGKTTFAEALAGQLAIGHFNSDRIRDELGKRRKYDAETKAQVYQSMLERAEKHLQEGADIIIDATFHKMEYRKPYLQLAENYGVSLKWIEMVADEATVKTRVAGKRAYSEADFSVFKKIKKTYEPLSFPHLTLSSDKMSLADMLAKTLAYLQQERL